MVCIPANTALPSPQTGSRLLGRPIPKALYLLMSSLGSPGSQMPATVKLECRFYFQIKSFARCPAPIRAGSFRGYAQIEASHCSSSLRSADPSTLDRRSLEAEKWVCSQACVMPLPHGPRGLLFLKGHHGHSVWQAAGFGGGGL